jgi:hypothetical protein
MYPRDYTVTAPGRGRSDVIWWDGRPVTARQFLGALERLPGFAEAKALNGGQWPRLVLVIRDAHAAAAGRSPPTWPGCTPGKWSLDHQTRA